MKKDKFERKVRRMEFWQILEAMITGIKREHVKLDFESFGHYGYDGICYGCAATNAICEISGKIPSEKHEIRGRDVFFDCNPLFLREFESAIDSLRSGSIQSYNYCATNIGLSTCSIPRELADGYLFQPVLSGLIWKENIRYYEDWLELIRPKQLSFEEKVRGMSFGDILQSMIDGLDDPYTLVNMGTFGEVIGDSDQRQLCFGCAATNAVCKINGKGFKPSYLGDMISRATESRSDHNFFNGFEKAINYLRLGGLSSYDRLAKRHGFANSTIYAYLPVLSTDDYKDRLWRYRSYLRKVRAYEKANNIKSSL